MIIMGIDPGIERVGFAFLDVTKGKKSLLKFGVIKTSSKKTKGERLLEINADLNALIGSMKPDICSIEQIFFSKNVKTAITVAEARGVILFSLEQNGIPIHEYTPSAMKSALTGNGRADKLAIQKMVQIELKLKEIPKSDDAADAISLALALAAELRYQS